MRQSFRNTDAEKRPRGGLEMLSGRFSLGPFPGLKAWAILFSPFGLQNPKLHTISRGQAATSPQNTDFTRTEEPLGDFLSNIIDLFAEIT